MAYLTHLNDLNPGTYPGGKPVMTTDIIETDDTVTQITVPARSAARAWINAFLAASTEETRPVLYRTLSIEFFEHGIQLIGCDGTALFRTWVTTEAAGEKRWPEAHDLPLRSIVVMDPDGFGLGFMRALLRVTNDEAHEHDELRLTIADMDDAAELSLGEEFLSERLTLRACGQRIDLRLYDGDYPSWRQLKFGEAFGERVDGMKVATRLLAMVGKIKGVSSTELEFHGTKKHVSFVAQGETEVRGFIMPMLRYDEQREAV